MYRITKYSLEQAKKLGVQIKPSTVKNKKIDVFKDGKKVASIGDIRYGDFATTQDKERRRLYRIRHKGEEKKIGSPGYYAWFLLW
jgi:hypothetical protein